MSQHHRRAIPQFDTPIVETHCHLDYLEETELQAVLEQAFEVGIERVVTISVSADNLDTVRALADIHPQVWCTQGIHPHEAESWDTSLSTRVRDGCTHDRVIAVGEIGLDYYYDHADRQAQISAFDEQLALAAELALPVVIHTREADEDTRAILANHSGSLVRKGVIHSFTSSLALAEFCLEEGFMLGFNGITTFRNADNVRSVVQATPVERIVLETDAPYLTPVPYRGRPNAPCYLPFIAETLADLKELPIEQFLEHARDNSYQLFF
ncbi:MAG: TatD family hydrolase [Proteobacteria bacterium]|nr:TatD family hydrolase [Pseudomonadota bacterium]